MLANLRGPNLVIAKRLGVHDDLQSDIHVTLLLLHSTIGLLYTYKSSHRQIQYLKVRQEVSGAPAM